MALTEQREVLQLALQPKDQVGQLDVGKGPAKAVKNLGGLFKTGVVAEEWLQEARMDAVVGSCKKSLPSVRSGVRCYMAFVDATVGEVKLYFPPNLSWLLAWSKVFRCDRTFSNYLGYVETACLLVDADVSVFAHPAIKRAKISIKKSGLFVARVKMFIQCPLVLQLVDWCVTNTEFLQFGYLFALAYIFLLRLPSEALPIVAGRDRDISGAKAVLSTVGDELVLTLRSRKNKLGGSRLVRGCWCKNHPSICPVHVFGKLVVETAEGQPLFPGITAARALAVLKCCLLALKIKDADRFRTQDLRRGHAKDLQVSGAPLWTILEAGEWRSPVFLSYLDLNQLDRDVVVQAHLDDSDDDG